MPRLHPGVDAASGPIHFRTRLVGLAVAAGATAVLAVAMWLEPHAAGHGTHEQLGLARCSWISLFDFPCPTCGMTTAFALAVRGELGASFSAQPAGFFLAIATGGAALVGLYVVGTGLSMGGLLARLMTGRLAWLAVTGLAMAWLFKILSVKGLLS